MEAPEAVRGVEAQDVMRGVVGRDIVRGVSGREVGVVAPGLAISGVDERGLGVCV